MEQCDSDPELFDVQDRLTYEILHGLFQFRNLYGDLHRYISVFLCVCGLCANALHVFVLTRPSMRSSSVHTVLTCIAISDIGTMASYLVYISRFEFGRDITGYAYHWLLFLKSHAALSIALHAITLYLVVFMAFIRYRAMQSKLLNRWLQPRLALVMSSAIAGLIFILCIPTLFAHEIYNSTRSTTVNITDAVVHESKYSIGFSSFVLAHHCFLLKANLWLTGILLKAVPCFLLIWFTILLLIKLRQNRRKRRHLILNTEKTQNRKSKYFGDRTTFMLLVMVTVFFITELPQGVMAIFNAIFTSQFHAYVYMQLADVLDLLSLINCYIGFLVFICTSSKYRQTLLSTLPIRRFHSSSSTLTAREAQQPPHARVRKHSSLPIVPHPMSNGNLAEYGKLVKRVSDQCLPTHV